MARIQFPTIKTVGTEHVHNGRKFRYDGKRWKHVNTQLEDLQSQIQTKAEELITAQKTAGNIIDANTYTATDVKAKITSVDGAGSGIDADMLDGQHGSYYAAASHNHDSRYYTEAEADARFVNASGDTMTGSLTVNGTVTSKINFASLASAPSAPVAGQVYYNSTLNKLQMWDGTVWKDVGSGGDAFKYRQIITTGYVMGGYKSGTPWKNVNRMVHATDVMTNLGDQIVYTASYSPAAPSKTTGWMFAAANAHSVATANVVGFNFATETARAANAANYMAQARNDAGVAFKEHDYVHILSNTTTDKFNFTTETSALSGLTIQADGTAGGVQAVCDENYAGLYADIGGVRTLHFAVDNVTADRVDTNPVAWGMHNQQKPINSKNRKGYAGNEGSYNGGYNYRVHDMVTATHEKTIARVMGNIGEENYDMGQDHQYCMGHYDGAQNNRGHKWFYTTDSGYELGAGSLRTGVAGGSSGGCVWKG